MHSLAGLIASDKYHKASLEKFLASAESYENGMNEPDYKDRRVKIDDLRVQLAFLMAKNNVAALLYRIPQTVEGGLSRQGDIPAGQARAGPIGIPIGTPPLRSARQPGLA